MKQKKEKEKEEEEKNGKYETEDKMGDKIGIAMKKIEQMLCERAMQSLMGWKQTNHQRTVMVLIDRIIQNDGILCALPCIELNATLAPWVKFHFPMRVTRRRFATRVWQHTWKSRWEALASACTPFHMPAMAISFGAGQIYCIYQ